LIRAVIVAVLLVGCIHVHAPKRVVIRCKLLAPVAELLAGEDAQVQCVIVSGKKDGEV
jgi:hypothetical protein